MDATKLEDKPWPERLKAHAIALQLMSATGNEELFYRALKTLLLEIRALPSDAAQAPVAWLHTMHMELGQTNERVTFDEANPWGVAGKNYSEEYQVTCDPLYSAPVPPAAAAPSIAASIHYPDCWDTAAYPTLGSALSEVYAAFKCSECGVEWRPATIAVAQPDERAAFELLRKLKGYLMRVRIGGDDTLASYRRACTEVECEIEEWLNAARATAPQATVKGDERWIERWHGSEPFRGWSIFSGRERIAFIGGDETLSEAVSEIVQAHNCAAVPQAGVTLTDGRILEIGRQFFRPGRDPDAEPQFVKAVRAVLDAARTEARDASQ